MLGDEPAARAALQQKAAVADALRHATRRAEANSALARWVVRQDQVWGCWGAVFAERGSTF